MHLLTRGWHLAGITRLQGATGPRMGGTERQQGGRSQVRGAGGGGRAQTSPPGIHHAPRAHGHLPSPVTLAGDNVASTGRWVRLQEIMEMGT